MPIWSNMIKHAFMILQLVPDFTAPDHHWSLSYAPRLWRAATNCHGYPAAAHRRPSEAGGHLWGDQQLQQLHPNLDFQLQHLGHDMARHGTTWHDMARHGTTCHDMSQHETKKPTHDLSSPMKEKEGTRCEKSWKGGLVISRDIW